MATLWDKAAEETINGVYETDRDAWVCTCEAFRRNQFLLCKHLINGMERPSYRDIERFRRPPFLRIRRVDGRRCPNIDNELHEYNQIGEEQEPLVNHETAAAAGLVRDYIPNHTTQSDASPTAPVNDDAQRSLQLASRYQQILQNLSEHITALGHDSSNLRQLEHLQSSIISRVDTYLSNVDIENNARTRRNTWSGNPDTLYLP